MDQDNNEQRQGMEKERFLENGKHHNMMNGTNKRRQLSAAAAVGGSSSLVEIQEPADEKQPALVKIQVFFFKKNFYM